MPIKLTLSQKLLLVASIVLAFELAFVGVLAWALNDAQRQLEEESHARAVISGVTRIANLSQKAGIEFMRFVITMQNRDTPAFTAMEDQVFQEEKRIRELLKDDPMELHAAERLQQTSEKIFSLFDPARQAYFDNDRTGHFAYLVKLHGLSDLLADQSNRIVEDFQKIETQSHDLQLKRWNEIKTWLVCGLVLNVLVVAVICEIFTRGITRRVKVLIDNHFRLASELPLHPEVQGNDEITALDRSFRKMSEMLNESMRRERAVVENTADVICSIGSDEKFAAVNSAALERWGYEPGELIGRRYMEFIDPGDREKTRQAMKEILSGDSKLQLENRVIHKDGSKIDVLWSAHWSADEKSLFCVAHDITERKRIERMRREFTNMISHDMRTPLSSIKGTLALLEQQVYDPKSEHGQRRVTAAIDNIDRLVQLISDLLELERIEAGMLSLDKREIDAQNLVASSVESVRSLADQKGIKLECSAQEGKLAADSGRLAQVLINLLSNALKFSPPESTVRVSSAFGDSYWQVEIEDEGSGITEDLQAEVFERFKQADERMDNEHRGTGLGLAICKAIVELHNGSIGVESDDGKGCKFWFRIPR